MKERVQLDAEYVMAAQDFLLRTVTNKINGDRWAQWDLDRLGYSAQGFLTAEIFCNQFWVSLGNGKLTRLSDGLSAAIRNARFLLIHHSSSGPVQVIQLSECETNAFFEALEKVYEHCCQ